MCGHSPLHHIQKPRNHRQEAHAPFLETEFTSPIAQVKTRPCPNCGTRLREDFVFCPRCGKDLLSACPQCHRAVEVSWSNCAFCGTELAAKSFTDSVIQKSK
jgi:RNA polymerase subunit RPABC4/transcription elongation factor Spt4